jgi:hypothetical protein
MCAFFKKKPTTGAALAAFVAALAVSGCSSAHLPRGMIGRLGKYDYSPSVIQTGTVRQFWWCGIAQNPNFPSQETDAILYDSMDTATGDTKGPRTVLAETPGAWDGLYTCNPKVVGGTFRNPLGDGATYKYAMYYVGIEQTSNNSIGVAFSPDGISWKKYPKPVIPASSPTGYGVGQPAPYNNDHQSAITLFYEDNAPYLHHVKATSADGVHFTVEGTLTTKGLDPICPGTWGDMAFDSKTGYWYALFDRPIRDPATTGGVQERGQLGVQLYRIPGDSLLTGQSPWEPLGIIDTNTTGFESNFIGGLVRDSYGTINVGSYPTIQMYVSVSDPQPGWNSSPKEAADSADPATWDIAPAEWVPDRPLLALARYSNGGADLVTTGWVSPYGRFQKVSILGHLYQSPRAAATSEWYACKSGDADFFVSLDPGCEGQRILGTHGFAYSQADPNLNLIALYRCEGAQGHFVSQDAKCEGQKVDGLLGYAMP